MIFISYARAEKQYAERLEHDLEIEGIGTWRDTRNLDPFQDFTGEIEVNIKAASHVVVCLTRDVKERTDSFVRREIAYALAQDRRRRMETPRQSFPVIPLVF